MAPDHPGATAEVDDSETAGEPEPTRPIKIVGAPPADDLAPAELPASDVVADDDLEPEMRKVRRGRRVKRVIRRIELWSVLKLALVFYTCMYVVVMGALVIIWGFAYQAGLVDNFESFANDVGFEHWQFYGEHMFRQAAVIGGVMVVGATVLTVLATALVNVISELTGGIRIVVIEEDIILVPVDEPRRARRKLSVFPAPPERPDSVLVPIEPPADPPVTADVAPAPAANGAKERASRRAKPAATGTAAKVDAP